MIEFTITITGALEDYTSVSILANLIYDNLVSLYPNIKVQTNTVDQYPPEPVKEKAQ